MMRIVASPISQYEGDARKRMKKRSPRSWESEDSGSILVRVFPRATFFLRPRLFKGILISKE